MSSPSNQLFKFADLSLAAEFRVIATGKLAIIVSTGVHNCWRRVDTVTFEGVNIYKVRRELIHA